MVTTETKKKKIQAKMKAKTSLRKKEKKNQFASIPFRTEAKPNEQQKFATEQSQNNSSAIFYASFAILYVLVKWMHVCALFIRNSYNILHVRSRSRSPIHTIL